MPMRLTPEAAIAYLAKEAHGLVENGDGRRLALGIAGGPGVGKSTIAGALVEALNQTQPGLAALVPMDGFHIKHARLEAMGETDRKGAPHTFEAVEFVAFLARSSLQKRQ